MLDRLPPELVEECISCLQLKDAFRVKETCRVLDKAVMRCLWKRVEIRVVDRANGRRVYRPKSCTCDRCESVDELPRCVDDDKRPPQFRDKGARAKLGVVVDRQVDVNKYALSQTRRRAFDLVQQLSIVVTADGDCEWILDDIIGHFKVCSLEHLNLTLITKKLDLLSKIQVMNAEQLAISLFPLRGARTNICQLKRRLANCKTRQRLVSLGLGMLSFERGDQVDPDYGITDQLGLFRDMMNQELATIQHLYIESISFNPVALSNPALSDVFTLSQSRLQSLMFYSVQQNSSNPAALTQMFSNKCFEQLHFLQICGLTLRTIVALLHEDVLQLPAVRHLNVVDKTLYSAITENPQGVNGLMNVFKTKCPRLDSILFIPFATGAPPPKLINAQHDNNIPSLAPHVHYMTVNATF